MRRNWIKIRELLERFEDETIFDYLDEVRQRYPYDSSISPEENEQEQERFEAEQDIVFGHLMLLMDSDLVEGFKNISYTASGWIYNAQQLRLTMKGHDTLDAIRSKSVWDRVRNKASEMAMPITQELILSVLKSMARLS